MAEDMNKKNFHFVIDEKNIDKADKNRTPNIRVESIRHTRVTNKVLFTSTRILIILISCCLIPMKGGK